MELGRHTACSMWKSLAIAYVAIPFFFYAADGIGHRIWPETSLLWRISGQVVLLGCAVCTFLILRRVSQAARRSPAAAAVGGCLGLLQLFPVYIEVGQRIFWDPAGVARGGWQEAMKLYSVNLVFPVVTLSGSAYDGTTFTLVATVATLLLLGAFLPSTPAVEHPKTSATPTSQMRPNSP